MLKVSPECKVWDCPPASVAALGRVQAEVPRALCEVKSVPGRYPGCGFHCHDNALVTGAPLRPIRGRCLAVPRTRCALPDRVIQSGSFYSWTTHRQGRVPYGHGTANTGIRQPENHVRCYSTDVCVPCAFRALQIRLTGRWFANIRTFRNAAYRVACPDVDHN